MDAGYANIEDFVCVLFLSNWFDGRRWVDFSKRKLVRSLDVVTRSGLMLSRESAGIGEGSAFLLPYRLRSSVGLRI